jgi:hypothetical protein
VRELPLELVIELDRERDEDLRKERRERAASHYRNFLLIAFLVNSSARKCAVHFSFVSAALLSACGGRQLAAPVDRVELA